MKHQHIEMRNFASEDFTPEDRVPQEAPSGTFRADGGRAARRFPLMDADAGHCEDREADSEVISGSAPSRHVWIVRSGILRLQRYAFDGRRQILSLLLPGEIVGFEGQFREGVSVETVTKGSLCRIDRRKFDTILTQSETLRAELFRQQQDQLDRLHWLTWSLGALGPEVRLSAFLALSTTFMPYRTLPDGSGLLSMILPRKDVADLLATTVETICRILHKLSGTGVIEIEDRGNFKINDLDRLIALGQIEGLFDRMARSLSARRYSLDVQSDAQSDCKLCSCNA